MIRNDSPMLSIIRTLWQQARTRAEARKLSQLATRHFQRGEFDDAIAMYRSVLSLTPSDAVGRMNLGLALYKAGKRREARDEWRAALESAKSNAYLSEQIAILLRQFG